MTEDVFVTMDCTGLSEPWRQMELWFAPFRPAPRNGERWAVFKTEERDFIIEARSVPEALALADALWGGQPLAYPAAD